MIFTETPLSGAYLVALSPHSDDRGWFVRTYDKAAFAQMGHMADWVQMNHSLTRQVGAIRGMHFQHPPHAEIKLVRCIAGKVFDVIVDLRASSPTFGQWFGAELSATNQAALYVPKGFAHGFQTLTSDCQLIYCHSEYYAPEHEGAIRFNDPKIGIDWPLPVTDISARDANHPLLIPSFTGLLV
ncbi:dTDP-4-dehydrorhamnose 3,5-epimerase [Spirosoma endophyticum]|uniref:dTDP-4-dehydrorhamnose 3,5-epimerase n=1 Tax=Spirosoma endophyticum TaxID=662367 RepID=A0A1I1X2G4_9BACT|nr:dTDP-4-dehydrorhamnose 3,5-epimerase [Spirosoma endophyticum]SFE01557.1 dTDP-4-dehydrorhamnose 3,5-epimerase [Spirosoma endophyticum]